MLSIVLGNFSMEALNSFRKLSTTSGKFLIALEVLRGYKIKKYAK